MMRPQMAFSATLSTFTKNNLQPIQEEGQGDKQLSDNFRMRSSTNDITASPQPVRLDPLNPDKVQTFNLPKQGMQMRKR